MYSIGTRIIGKPYRFMGEHAMMLGTVVGHTSFGQPMPSACFKDQIVWEEIPQYEIEWDNGTKSTIGCGNVERLPMVSVDTVDEAC